MSGSMNYQDFMSSAPPVSAPPAPPGGMSYDEFMGSKGSTPQAAAQPSPPAAMTYAQFMAAPGPAAATSTGKAGPQPLTGLLANTGAGTSEAIAGMAGAPVDLVTGGINLASRGIKAATGFDAGQIKNPIGGSNSIKSAFGLVGADPRNVEPATDTERYVRAATAGATGMLVPGLGAAALPEAAGAAGAVQAGLRSGAAPAAVASGAVGGVGGQAAEDLAPDAWRPIAGLAGNLVFGGLTGGASAGGRAVMGAAADRTGQLLRPFVGKAAPVINPETGSPLFLSDITGLSSDAHPVMATPGQQQMAGARLLQSASDPGAALDTLSAGWRPLGSGEAAPAGAMTRLDSGGQAQYWDGSSSSAPYVPGSNPTTFQVTNDPGLGQLERAAASKNQGLFVARAEQQRAARAAYVGDAAGNGDPAAVGDLARSTLDNLQAQSEAQAAGLRQAAQGAVNQMGGQVPASTDGATALQSFGAAMRDPLDQANQAAKANVSQLFNAFDPDGTAKFDMSPVKAAGGQLGQIGPNAAPLAGEEGAIMMRARLMPAVQSAQDFQDFYSRVGTAMRAARVDPAQAQSYGRLSQLMDSLHQAVSATVARSAEADPSVADRLEAFSGGGADQNAQSAAVGQSYGGSSAQTPGAQSDGAVGYNRTGGQIGGGFGSPQGRAGIPQTARPPAPEGLVSFLTRSGGVYDDGGDLASMGAGKLRVGFLRKPPESATPGQAGMGFGGFNSGNSNRGEPMQLDYARQKAIDAGYLPEGSDLTDFKAAIGEDLRGNGQFVPEDLAAYRAAGGRGASDRETAALEGARSDVADAAREMGGNLGSDMTEHAARLVVMGIDPHEAVQQAVDAPVRAYLDGRTFTGEPGMPANAAQAGMHVPEPMPPGGAFMSQEAADRLAAAKRGHKDRIDTYVRAPGVGSVLARGPTAGTFKMATSAVPSAIWSGGKGAAEKVSAYLRAGGDPDAVQSYAAFDLRKAALRGDGTLDPAKLQAWQAKHSEELQAFPALRKRFSTAAAATTAMDDAAARVVAQTKAHQASALGLFIGDAEPERTVARMLGADDAPARMAQLAEQVKGSPAAVAGLRHAVMSRYLPMVAGDSFKALPKALTKEWLAISKVLAPDQLKVLQQTQADLARSERSGIGTKIAGQSNTTPDAHAVANHGAGGHAGNMLSQILAATILEGAGEMAAHMAGAATFRGSAIRLGTTVAGAVGNAMRQNGIRQVDDLVAYAAANPALARTLMQRAITTPKAGSLMVLRHQLGAMAVGLAGGAGQSAGSSAAPQ